MQQRYQTPDGHIYEQQGGEYVLVEPAAVPATPGGIVTRPADPARALELQQRQLAIAEAQRQAANAPVVTEAARANAQRAQIEADMAARQAADPAGNAAVEQRRAAGFYLRASRSNQLYEQQGVGARSPTAQTIRDMAPDYIGNALTSSARQQAEAAQRDFIAATLRYESGAAIPTEELESQRRIFFPAPGDTDETVRLKAELRRNAIESLQLGGGQASRAVGPPPVPSIDGEQLDRHQQVTIEATPQAAQVAPADQGYRSEADPTLRGVNARIQAMLRNGVPDAQIREYITGVGIPLNQLHGLEAVLSHRRNNPNFRGNYGVDVETRNVPISAARQAVTSLADTAGGAYFTGAANALTAGYLPELAPGDTELNRAGIDSIRNDHPLASTLGEISGGTQAILAPQAGLARYTRLGEMLANAPRLRAGAALGADTAYGAAYGSGMSPDDRIGGALRGAAVALPASIAGQGATRFLGNIVGGAETSPLTQRMVDQGFVLSPAQRAAGNETLLGTTRRRVDDALRTTPILGDAMNAQTRRQMAQLGRASVSEALQPIGVAAPRELSGNELMEFANRQVSEAYDRALPGIRAPLDPDFIAANNAVRTAAASLPQAQRETFDTIYERAVTPFIPRDGVLTGQALQDIKRGLDKQILRLANTSNPADEYLADELVNLRGAFFDWAARAAPERVEDFRNANAAFANMVRVNRAAAAAKADGVFTPNQLLGAIKANSSDAAFASGGLPMQQLGQDAQRVLPATVPDSGTATRTMINMAAPAVVAGGAHFAPALTPLAVPYGLKTISHLPAVDRMLQAIALRRTAALARAGSRIRARARGGGAASTAASESASQ